MSHFDEAVKVTIAANERQRKADLLEVLSTPAGRRVYAMLVENSGLYGAPPADEPDRSEWMGRRAFGLEIRKAFRDASPKLCFDAEQEMDAARENDQEAIRRAKQQDLKESQTRR